MHERRLAAILAADVVGFSRQMGADEAATLARIAALRTDVLEPLLTEHRGRLFKIMGDGVNIAARLEPLAEPGGISLCRRGIYSSRQLARACEERVDVMAVTGLNRPARSHQGQRRMGHGLHRTHPPQTAQSSSMTSTHSHRPTRATHPKEPGTRHCRIGC